MSSYTIKNYRHSRDLRPTRDLMHRNNFFKDMSSGGLLRHLKRKYDPRFTRLSIAVDGGTVIGSTGTIQQPLLVNHRSCVNSFYLMDICVDTTRPLKTRPFCFAMLLRRQKKICAARGFLFVFPSATIRDTLLRTGWINIPIFWEFRKDILRRPAPRISSSAQDVVFERVRRFEESWDRTWRAICLEYPVINLRERASLNWRYAHSQETFLIFIAKRNNRPCGYFVCAQRQHEGLILDYLVSPRDAGLLGTWIEYLERFFYERKIFSIRWCLSYGVHKKLLHILGFRFLRKIDFFVAAGSTRQALLEDLLALSHRWFMTGGDGDFQME